MPASYDIQPPVVTLRLEGFYSSDEIRDAMRLAFADPALPTRAVLLVDLTAGAVGVARRSPDEVRASVSFLAAYAPLFNRRMGFAAPADVAFGMMRIASVEAEQRGVEVEVFRDAPSARAWLVSTLRG